MMISECANRSTVPPKHEDVAAFLERRFAKSKAKWARLSAAKLEAKMAAGSAIQERIEEALADAFEGLPMVDCADVAWEWLESGEVIF